MKLPDFEIVEARNSSLTRIPELFAYIDHRSIGVHELPRAANTKAVYDSVTEIGYRGPAISAYFSFNDDPLGNVVPNSVLDLPYGTVGVADGHNRLETFRRLHVEGYLRSPIIPIQLVPAHDTRIIRLWDLANPHSEVIHEMCARCLGTLSLIDACHVDPNKVTKDLTLCFTTYLKDGAGIRIRGAQPDIVMAKEDFLR